MSFQTASSALDGWWLRNPQRKHTLAFAQYNTECRGLSQNICGCQQQSLSLAMEVLEGTSSSCRRMEAALKAQRAQEKSRELKVLNPSKTSSLLLND